MRLVLPKHQAKLVKAFISKDKTRAYLSCVCVQKNQLSASDGKRGIRIDIFESKVPDGTYRPFFSGNDIDIYKETEEHPGLGLIMPNFSDLKPIGNFVEIPTPNMATISVELIKIFRDTGRKLNATFLKEMATKKDAIYEMFSKAGEEKDGAKIIFFRSVDDNSLVSGRSEICVMPLVSE
jgi:hypothetical protein